jgi:hypothetical protein
MKKRPGELFADHLMLELAVVFNCLHFLILLTASLLDHRKYLYFSLAFTSAGKLGELVRFVVLFLMPSILAVVFALLLNAVSKKPAWVRKPLAALGGVSIAAFMVYALVCSAVFTSMMPFASHTTKPEHFGKYDEKVMANVPTQNCPVSITAVPDGARDFRCSYTYTRTVDYEWTVEASYTMDAAAYAAQKAAMTQSLRAACTPEITRAGSLTRCSTGDYLDVFGKAATFVSFVCDDDARKISFTLSAFAPLE